MDHSIIIKNKIKKYLNEEKDCRKKYKQFNFEQILDDIIEKNIEKDVIGLYTCFVYATNIALRLGIYKNKIYLYHPKIHRTIKILGITNIYKIKINNFYFKYVTLKDLIEGFEKIKIAYNSQIINENNIDFDQIEKYLLYWQKQF
jgi:hypothetical protein